MYELQGFFSKIVLIIRIFSKIVRICSKIMYGLYGFFFENCTDSTDFFRKSYGLYGFPVKMYGFLYGFFQKSFGHPVIFDWVSLQKVSCAFPLQETIFVIDRPFRLCMKDHLKFRL